MQFPDMPVIISDSANPAQCTPLCIDGDSANSVGSKRLTNLFQRGTDIRSGKRRKILKAGHEYFCDLLDGFSVFRIEGRYLPDLHLNLLWPEPFERK